MAYITYHDVHKLIDSCIKLEFYSVNIDCIKKSLKL